MLGELVVDVEVLQDRVAAANLEPGSWFTVYDDPTGGCALMVVELEARVDDAEEGAP